MSLDLEAAERRNRFWRAVGITLAVVMTIAGLAVAAAVVLFVVAINSWGSNK
jgi:biopolymer transport protein ExbB/TolQ